MISRSAERFGVASFVAWARFAGWPRPPDVAARATLPGSAPGGGAMANREGRYTWVADPTDVRKLERLVAEEDEARSRVDDWPPQGALKQHSRDPRRWAREE